MADPALVQYNLCAHYEENFIFRPEVPRPLPVVVITGYLGSGKTTLLERLLGARGNLRIAAVAHDLASLNVDAAFLAAEKSLRRADAAIGDGAVLGLGGCACCPDFDVELKGVVKTSLKEGVDEGYLDYLILETSGAADPRRLVTVLEQRFGPCTRARLDRVVAVVDAEQVAMHGERWLETAENGHQELANQAEARLQRAQLACADVIVLNKVDLIDREANLVALERLRELCPYGRVLACSYGDVSLADILEVSEAATAESTAGLSHEATAATWVVPQDLKPRPRPAATAPSTNESLPPVGFTHAGRHRLVEWSNCKRPVVLARLQAFLSLRLPTWEAFLRRGKGLLWVAEDPGVRWEWQVSGRLRYSCRRDAEGFGGAAPSSGLVLIFATSTPDSVLEAAGRELEALVEPLSAGATDDGLRRFDEAVGMLTSGDPSFQVLDSNVAVPLGGDNESFQEVISFRLTGRSRFGIPPDADLTVHPYSVDVDSMNTELARLVNIAQGGSFLAIGSASETIGESGVSREVVVLLWPLSVCELHAHLEDAEVPPPPATPLLEIMLGKLRLEADSLLKRYFAHVQACRCGQ